MKLMESTYPTMLLNNLKAEGCDFKADWSYKLAEVTFKSIADLLSIVKSKTVKKAVACRDLKNNLILAGIVEYHAGENDSEDVGGNFSFVFTTDESDLEGAETINFTESQYQRIFASVGQEMYNMKVNDSLYIVSYSTCSVKTLIDVLKTNAKDGEQFEIEEEGFFKGISTVNNGEIEIAIVPGDTLKTIIKDDKDV